MCGEGGGIKQEAAGSVATCQLDSEGENVEDRNLTAEKSVVAVSQFLSHTSLCRLSGKHRCRNLFPAIWAPKRFISKRIYPLTQLYNEMCFH